MNTRIVRLATLMLCSLAVEPLTAAVAQEQPPAVAVSAPAAAAATGGLVDPEGIPPRPPAVDIAPVYRGPAVDTLATIRKRGVLRVGVATAEPMVMHDDKGALIGFSIDLARKLAEDIGVSVQFVETSWSRIIPDLLENQYDVIASGLWVTPVRALVVNFSTSASIEGVYLIANRQLAGAFKTLEEFNRPEVKIAVYLDTAQERVAKKRFPRATLVPITGDALDLDLAIEGQAHAALVTTFAPRILVGTAADKLSLPFAEALVSTETAIAVRKGDPDFLNYLNSWLSFQRGMGWLEERARYWAEPQDWMK